MPDFASLLNKPAGEAKKPPALPAGDYPGKILRHEVGDNNSKNTPYVRFHLQLMAFPEDIEPEDREGIDLSKRAQRRDFYLTEDSMWRLDDFLNSLLGSDAVVGRSYQEVFPDTHGADVLVTIKQELNQKSNEIYSTVDKILPLG